MGQVRDADRGLSRPYRQRGAWQGLSTLAPIGGTVDGLLLPKPIKEGLPTTRTLVWF